MEWSKYDAWNGALVDTFFGAESAYVPAYVDADDDTLAMVASRLGVGGDPFASLVAAVRETLGFFDGSVLAGHGRRLDAWRRQFTIANTERRKGASIELPPPPVVALLCVLVGAAQKMGADSSMAANAYYPRLAQVLGLGPEDGRRLQSKFKQTEPYWRALNDYLAAYEGQRGLPTAYALSYRYVGIPQSQALVRAADRSKLPEFFSKFGLAPGSEVIPSDLERLLDAWITSGAAPVSSNLERLWRGGKARERVAGVVAVELSLWDGSLEEDTDSPQLTRQAGEVRLTLVVRQQFGSRSLELSFVAGLRGSHEEVTSLVVTSAEGSPAIGVLPAPGKRLRPIPGSRFDGPSLVGAVLTMEIPGNDRPILRTPRRVVPFRKDDLLGVLVESEKVQLAEDTVLLVKDEPALLEAVLGVVDAYGRRGKVYRGVASSGSEVLRGVPDGWVLVDDVQIYDLPQDVKRLDLHVLVPLTTAQLHLSGGLKLPGRIRKWSTLSPPQIRAAVADANKITLTLTSLDDEEVKHSWSEAATAMVVNLDDLGLVDGDYEVELAVGDETISRVGLRLRSADSPDAVTWESCTRLNYELSGNAAAVVSAVPATDESEVIVDGLNALGRWPAAVPAAPVALGATWSTQKRSSGVERPTVVLGVPDSKSCVVTGAHRIMLPTWHGGRSSSRTIVGVCQTCGLRKTLPARPRWKGQAAPAVEVKEHRFDALGGDHDLHLGWDVCLDALVHVGGGQVSGLERVAAQAEGTSLFADRFIRTLEMLGHIDVRRDDAMLPVEWEANPAYLAETTSRGFVLAGVWSETSRARLGNALRDLGGTLVPERSQDNELTSWFARGVTADDLRSSADALGLAAEVVSEAPSAILEALPPLGELETALPRVPIPAYQKASIFDLSDASWRAVPGVAVPGAYRVEQSFRRVNIWVDEQGALDRTAQVGSVHLVKHLAARAARRPLLGWLPSSSVLVVPVGADLPGLYGRAAAACSGREPVASSRTRALGYHDVPRHVADELNARLLG